MICEVKDNEYLRYCQKLEFNRKSAKTKARLAAKEVKTAGKSSSHYNFYYKIGNSAKEAYSVTGTSLDIKSNPTFEALKKISLEDAENFIVKSAKITYKKEAKLKELKNFALMSYILLTDKSNPICHYTRRSCSLFNEFSKEDISFSTFKGLIKMATNCGIIAPNTYIDENGKVKKNFRHDVVCPENSYSTAYLLNTDAIVRIYGKDIKAPKEYKKFFSTVKEKKLEGIASEELAIALENIDQTTKRLFSGLYSDFSFKTKDSRVKIKVNIDSKEASDLKLIVCNLLKYLKEKGYKLHQIEESKEYNEIVKLISLAENNKTSIDTIAWNCMKQFFNFKSKGSYIYFQKLLNEYNTDKDDFTRKELNLNVSKKSISTRAYSRYCKTSKKDGTRQKFIEDYNVPCQQDVTSMIPNLLRFLKAGDVFTTQDAYTKIQNSLKKEGFTLSRKEIKSVFLRTIFSKSLSQFLCSIETMLAEKYKDDVNNTNYYPFIKSWSRNSKVGHYISSDWRSTAEGQKQRALYSKLYSIIDKEYGTKQSSFMFFWESLLETIVTISLKRKGITCYNVYDNFISDKEFDLLPELQSAGKIVLDVYNGDLTSIKEFIKCQN